jgi:hypothetical protein
MGDLQAGIICDGNIFIRLAWREDGFRNQTEKGGEQGEYET